jgi:hypothetical protein
MYMYKYILYIISYSKDGLYRVYVCVLVCVCFVVGTGGMHYM